MPHVASDEFGCHHFSHLGLDWWFRALAKEKNKKKRKKKARAQRSEKRLRECTNWTAIGCWAFWTSLHLALAPRTLHPIFCLRAVGFNQSGPGDDWERTHAKLRLSERARTRIKLQAGWHTLASSSCKDSVKGRAFMSHPGFNGNSNWSLSIKGSSFRWSHPLCVPASSSSSSSPSARSPSSPSSLVHTADSPITWVGKHWLMLKWSLRMSGKTCQFYLPIQCQIVAGGSLLPPSPSLHLLLARVTRCCLLATFTHPVALAPQLCALFLIYQAARQLQLSLSIDKLLNLLHCNRHRMGRKGQWRLMQTSGSWVLTFAFFLWKGRMERESHLLWLFCLLTLHGKK